jgi:hypothetical protein
LWKLALSSCHESAYIRHCGVGIFKPDKIPGGTDWSRHKSATQGPRGVSNPFHYRATFKPFDLFKENPVARRRIEMFEYRHALVRLRAGDTLREIARSGLMGRDRLATFGALAKQEGWLAPQGPLPDDQTLS